MTDSQSQEDSSVSNQVFVVMFWFLNQTDLRENRVLAFLPYDRKWGKICSAIQHLQQMESPAAVCLVNSPEELVQISMLHVFKDHDERVAVDTHPIELHYVLVLEVGQQFSFTLEILSGCKSGIF